MFWSPNATDWTQSTTAIWASLIQIASKHQILFSLSTTILSDKSGTVSLAEAAPHLIIVW